MYSVTKEYSFDSAHRLVQGYAGKCAHVHGHTWRIRVTAKSETLNLFGFVTDFSLFKPLKDWIDEHLDHATMVSMHDLPLIKWLIENNQRHFICAENPTSEYLCKFLFGVADEFLHLNPSAVEIDETCTSCARYEP